MYDVIYLRHIRSKDVSAFLSQCYLDTEYLFCTVLHINSLFWIQCCINSHFLAVIVLHNNTVF